MKTIIWNRFLVMIKMQKTTFPFRPSATSGIFFLNAAEQWVDISNGERDVSAYFITDGGAFDVFVLLGPTPEDVARQYTSLTGVAPLPQVTHYQNHF